MQIKSSFWTNNVLRENFNALTQQVFCFDFKQWYEGGYWTERFNPHSMFDGEEVIANVSVNRMEFAVCGKRYHLLQLGTVMTAPEHRGNGYNRKIMEKILREEAGKKDGVYLFGNDSVLQFYPRFGFRVTKEVVYFKDVTPCEGEQPALVQRKMSSNEEINAFLKLVEEHEARFPEDDPNDGFAMRDNPGLYAFWLLSEYGECVYHLPEQDAWLIATVEGDTLHIVSAICDHAIDFNKAALAFGLPIKKITLGFTPRKIQDWSCGPYHQEDTTLFIQGSAIEKQLKTPIHFPEISHA